MIELAVLFLLQLVEKADQTMRDGDINEEDDNE